MKKEISEKIKEFIKDLPHEQREHWTNFGGGYYPFVVMGEKQFENELESLIEEILELEEKSAK